jgi:hypothetical protein
MSSSMFHSGGTKSLRDHVRKIIEDVHRSADFSALGMPMIVYRDKDSNQVFDIPVVFSEVVCPLQVFDQYANASSFDQQAIVELRNSLADISGVSNIRVCEIGDYFISVRVSSDPSGHLPLRPVLSIAKKFNLWICEHLRGERTDGPMALPQPGEFHKSNNWVYLGIP